MLYIAARKAECDEEECEDEAKIAKFTAHETRLIAERKKTKAALTRLGHVAPTVDLEEDTGGVVFRTSTATGPSMDKAKVQNLAERIVAGWTNKPEVVTDATICTV
jgi:hypothetical protein